MQVRDGVPTEVKPDDAGWMVTEKIGTPMGEASDMAVLDKARRVEAAQVGEPPVLVRRRRERYELEPVACLFARNHCGA